MPDIYGTNYSASDVLKRTPGARVDAGERSFENWVNLATEGGGTTNPFIVATAREGCKLVGIEVTGSVSLAGVNISAGIAGSTAKYAASVAGPAADVQLRMNIKASALDDDELAAPETLILTPSANWPATGTLYARAIYTKR